MRERDTQGAAPGRTHIHTLRNGLLARGSGGVGVLVQAVHKALPVKTAWLLGDRGETAVGQLAARATNLWGLSLSLSSIVDFCRCVCVCVNAAPTSLLLATLIYIWIFFVI